VGQLKEILGCPTLLNAIALSGLPHGTLSHRHMTILSNRTAGRKTVVSENEVVLAERYNHAVSPF
jgi:hypothetical protein